MKSRDIQGKMFLDSYYQSLSMKEKIGWTYLLFNEHINWLGCQELTERTILFEMGCDEISCDDFKAMKVKFEIDGKVCWLGNWYLIKNSDKYSNHLTNIQIMGTAYDQFMAMPEEVKAFFYENKPRHIAEQYKEMFETVQQKRLDDKKAKEKNPRNQSIESKESERKESISSLPSNQDSSLPSNLEGSLQGSSSNKTQDTSDMKEVRRESEGGEEIASEFTPEYLDNEDFIAYLKAEYQNTNSKSELKKMKLDLAAHARNVDNYRAWAEKWIFGEEEKFRKKYSPPPQNPTLKKQPAQKIEEPPPEPYQPRKIEDIETETEARQKIRGWILTGRIEKNISDAEKLAKKFGLDLTDLGYVTTLPESLPKPHKRIKRGRYSQKVSLEKSLILDPL